MVVEDIAGPVDVDTDKIAKKIREAQRAARDGVIHTWRYIERADEDDAPRRYIIVSYTPMKDDA